MKNLILIGMPGAGKSTVGVVLAKQQGYHFVDSDLVIQEQTGLLLHEKIGVVIYLKLSCESIAARLGDLRKRGITLREGQTLQQLYDERVPLYERYADITVNCENKSIREIVAEIVARLPK